MIEAMLCKRCYVADVPANLNVMLVHADGRNGPHTEGPLCDGCVEVRQSEIDNEPGAGRVLETAKLQRVEDE